METSQTTAGSGLWNNPRATKCSKEAQDMMRIIKQESRLTSLQRRQNKSQNNGSILRTTSVSAPPSASRESVQKRLVYHPHKRSAESCRAGDSYMREKFNPGPTRDLEKEKRRLQSIMATGKEEPRTAVYKKTPACQNPDVSEEIDRYQEVLDEIEERRQFLADMASLGQERQYIDIINSEISQKIRELELLDKTSTQK